jgi:hypothetical protein
MSVCCVCYALSGRGLCDELITRPEESYRLWCVVVCDQETSWMRRPWPALGRKATRNNNKNNNNIMVCYVEPFIIIVFQSKIVAFEDTLAPVSLWYEEENSKQRGWILVVRC